MIGPQAARRGPVTALELPFRFDPARLRADLALIHPAEWHPHYNEQDHGGIWTGAALRAVSGDSTNLLALTATHEFSDTPALQRCPYFQEVLARFACPLKAVRLLSLGPGSRVREHCDEALGFEQGEVRLHIPVQTNPQVEFYCAGERLPMEEGGCYYVNVSLPHRVINGGDSERVHLVIDADVNTWLEDLFARGTAAPRGIPSASGFVKLREVVVADAGLSAQLHAIEERHELVRALVDLGKSSGIQVEAEEIERRFGKEFPGEIVEARHGRDWFPTAAMGSGLPLAEWVYLGGKQLDEPFVDDTVRVALRNPFARLFRHTAALPPASGPGPDGFIFHTSRCGSTLLAAMMRAAGKGTLLSEAPAMDDAIRTGDTDCLRAVAGALRRNDGPCLAKLDAWNIHRQVHILETFPRSRWVFLYRDPLEVLVSQVRAPGRFVLPGGVEPEVVGMKLDDLAGMERDEWCARVLGGIFQKAVKMAEASSGGLLVNYCELPEAGRDLIPSHFGIVLTENDRRAMRAAAGIDAKHQARAFVPDGEAKQREATPRLRTLADRFLYPSYFELERIRKARL
jgi:mannose-6-phosphate isomerase-like protein (cupin superfamily)